MRKIKVYFTNGNVGIFDRDATSFRDHDGTYFFLGSEDEDQDELRHEFSTLLDAGPFVNWDAVSYVRAYEDPADD